jgi:hypothetical protein
MLKRFHVPPDNDSAYVAVAIRRVGSGLHTGIMHRKNGGTFSLLHLRWHLDVAEEPPSTNYGWATPKLHSSRQRSVAALCRHIAKIYPAQGLPYALAYDKELKFNKADGKLLTGKGGRGFTCATFVLAVFESCGVSLLELTTWPPRPSDRTWQEFVIEELRKTPTADASHVEGVTQEIGCLRYQPDEVAGGCLLDAYPCKFEDVLGAASQLMTSLDDYYSKIAAAASGT